jgi:hypothetical protein
MSQFEDASNDEDDFVLRMQMKVGNKVQPDLPQTTPSLSTGKASVVPKVDPKPPSSIPTASVATPDDDYYYEEDEQDVDYDYMEDSLRGERR